MYNMQNISQQTYMLVGARRFDGGVINGSLLPASTRVIVNMSMDESEGNALGLNSTSFKCTGPEIFNKMKGMDLPCIANLTLSQVVTGSGKVSQIVQDVEMVTPVKLPEPPQQSTGVSTVTHKKTN